MIQTVLNFLSNLKLTLTQYAVLAAAAAVGLLVVAFRRQGQELHRAQVELLGKTFDAASAANDAATGAALDRYHEALDSFLKAGGRL